MTKEFKRGDLEIDFPVAAFSSARRVLLRSLRLFFENFGFLAKATLLVYVPVKFSFQLLCNLLGFPPGGLAAYAVIDLTDLIFGALVAPAIIYGLVGKMRTGRLPGMRDCFRWGRRQWGKTLWNQVKVSVTVALWGALLVVPGLVVMIRLIFADAIVAVEGDRQSDVLQRSRDIVAGHGWRIFAVMAPVGLLDLLVFWGLMSVLRDAGLSWALVAGVDCILSIGAQWAAVVVLLMYLGLTAGTAPGAPGRKAAKSLHQ